MMFFLNFLMTETLDFIPDNLVYVWILNCWECLKIGGKCNNNVQAFVQEQFQNGLLNRFTLPPND